MRALIAELAPELAEHALSKTSDRWTFVLPNAPDSTQITRGLQRLLAAVAPTPQDSVRRFVRITTEKPSGAYAIYHVDIGVEWRCAGSPPRWVGSGREVTIELTRTDVHDWRTVRTGPLVNYDAALCSF